VKPANVVTLFVASINKGDLEELSALLTPDHVLKDGGGDEVSGEPAVREAWQAYWSLFPDYEVHIEHLFEAGEWVALFGSAEGTFSADGSLDPRNHWSIPAAWLASVRDDHVATWQVFADNEPVRAIVKRNG
jgi:ketosteroid isomerase-like protein